MLVVSLKNTNLSSRTSTTRKKIFKRREINISKPSARLKVTTESLSRSSNKEIPILLERRNLLKMPTRTSKPSTRLLLTL